VVVVVVIKILPDLVVEVLVDLELQQDSQYQHQVHILLLLGQVVLGDILRVLVLLQSMVEMVRHLFFHQ